MAPDKIYIAVSTGPAGIVDRIWTDQKRSNPAFTSVEYLRKDALLDWAKERKAQLKKEAAGCSNMLAAGEWLAYDKLIEKIESL